MTKRHGAQNLAHRRNPDRLAHGERPAADGCAKAVGDIVRTEAVREERRSEAPRPEDPRIVGRQHASPRSIVDSSLCCAPWRRRERDTVGVCRSPASRIESRRGPGLTPSGGDRSLGEAMEEQKKHLLGVIHELYNNPDRQVSGAHRGEFRAPPLSDHRTQRRW